MMKDGIGTEVKLGSLVVHADSSKYAGVSSIGIITRMTDKTVTKDKTALCPSNLIVIDDILKADGRYDKMKASLEKEYPVDTEVRKSKVVEKWKIIAETTGYSGPIKQVAVVKVVGTDNSSVNKIVEDFKVENGIRTYGNDWKGRDLHSVDLQKHKGGGTSFERYSYGKEHMYARTKCPVSPEQTGHFIPVSELRGELALKVEIYNKKACK